MIDQHRYDAHNMIKAHVSLEFDEEFTYGAYRTAKESFGDDHLLTLELADKCSKLSRRIRASEDVLIELICAGMLKVNNE